VVRDAGSSVDPVKEMGVAGTNPGSGVFRGVHDTKTINRRTAVPVYLYTMNPKLIKFLRLFPSVFSTTLV
jgi:hypothetical protein